ncbi:YlbF family regulator [Scopulibacillus cellulosilyticus]|uniref:YlbF family regulator n=1 Tax=Scopulibacillus cellulosilyticus TaxID=2665665 RepID=A0ABW2PSQ0_9BACL
MITTLEHVSVLEETDGLIGMLKHSDVFEHYRNMRDKLAKDQEAQSLIRDFVKVREKYDEVQRFGKYHPDYKQVIQNMMDIKRDVDLNDTIASYKKAEEQMEHLLNEISLEIARAVSDSIKVPTGNPFFDRGCGGGCGTGGKCGCH